jgi:hypothetical protein
MMRNAFAVLSLCACVSATTGCMASIGHDWREQPRRAVREPVTARAVGGDVRVTAAPLGARALSVGGDIRIRSAERYVRARSFGGSIEIGAVRGDAQVVTYGGNVRMRVVNDSVAIPGGREIEITAHGGDVTLYLPESWPMKIEVDVEYFEDRDGDRLMPTLESDFQLSLSETDQWKKRMLGMLPRSKHIYGKATVGEGTHRVRIKSEGGNVRIRKLTADQ